MIGILAGHPLRRVADELQDDGAEFDNHERVQGIWRHSAFRIFPAQSHYDAKHFYGMVLTDIILMGPVHSECIQMARTRVDRYGASNNHAFSRRHSPYHT